MSRFKLLLIFASLFFILFGITNVSAMTDHETECAIWLCAPSGFLVGECDPPHEAMNRRIARGHSPAPPFPSCGGDNGSQRYGNAAYIPERTVCVDWWGGDDGSCRTYATYAEEYIKDTRCSYSDGHHEPDGCTHNFRFLDIIVDGVQIGETYYSHPRRVY